MSFYTYLHRRVEDGQVFYVGKGARRRANEKNNRNVHWERVVAKHGWAVDILARWLSQSEALEHEKFLIACFRDLGAPLVNMTDGGDGAYGCAKSAETREKISRAKKGVPVHTAESKARIAASLSKAVAGRPMSDACKAAAKAANTGRKFTEEHRAKIAAAGKGRAMSAAAREKIRAAMLKRWSRS